MPGAQHKGVLIGKRDTMQADRYYYKEIGLKFLLGKGRSIIAPIKEATELPDGAPMLSLCLVGGVNVYEYDGDKWDCIGMLDDE